MRQRLTWLAAALVLLGLVAFVWPTRYVTRLYATPERGAYGVRVDRFTNEAFVLTATGWRRAQSVARDPLEELKALPTAPPR